MPEWITTLQFHEADGVDDWRLLGSGVSACFRTESWSRGVELIDAIGKLAEVDSHRPAIDLGPRVSPLSSKPTWSTV